MLACPTPECVCPSHLNIHTPKTPNPPNTRKNTNKKLTKKTRVRYNAYGAGPTNLDCKKNTVTNPDWQDSGALFQDIKTECNPASVQISATQITGVA